MVFDVSLEMQSDSKNYVSVQGDEMTELAHTTKSACAWHLENLRLHRQLEIFNELLQKAVFKTLPGCRAFRHSVFNTAVVWLS